MKQLLVIFLLAGLLTVSTVHSRALAKYQYCTAINCSSQEEACAIDRSGCMVAFKAYLDCVKSNSICTSIASTSPFGDCYKKCAQTSTASAYYNLTVCYESCGAAEYSTLLKTLSLSFILVVFAFCM